MRLSFIIKLQPKAAEASQKKVYYWKSDITKLVVNAKLYGYKK